LAIVRKIPGRPPKFYKEVNMDITELLERSPINFREWKEPVEAIVKFTHGALWLSVYIGIAYGVAWRKEK
jgi:hypothetical protein